MTVTSDTLRELQAELGAIKECLLRTGLLDSKLFEDAYHRIYLDLGTPPFARLLSHENGDSVIELLGPRAEERLCLVSRCIHKQLTNRVQARKSPRHCLYMSGGLESPHWSHKNEDYYTENLMISSTVEQFDMATRRCIELAPMPAGRCMHAMTVMQGSIYVTGGVMGINLPDNSFECATDTAICLSLGGGTWKDLPCLNSTRAGHVSLEFDGSLFALGTCIDPRRPGAYKIPDMMSKTVDVLDQAQNKWDCLPPIPWQQYGASLCEFVAVAMGGSIWVCCGHDGADYHSGILFSSPAADFEWKSLKQKIQPRESVAHDVLYGRLFLCGGKFVSTGGKSCDVLKSVQMIDPAGKHVTDLQPMHVARYGAHSAIANGKICVVGGYESCRSGYQCTVVELYDPFSNIWEQLLSTPVNEDSLCICASEAYIHVFGGRLEDTYSSTYALPAHEWQQVAPGTDDCQFDDGNSYRWEIGLDEESLPYRPFRRLQKSHCIVPSCSQEYAAELHEVFFADACSTASEDFDLFG